MELLLPDFASPTVWISLLTLSFLEIVLGIDNIIFISIVAGELPKSQQRKARNIGLLLAMAFRVGLLLCISWIIGLKDPVVTIPSIAALEISEISLSYKDLILIAGGIFLIIKSTMEIHHKFQKKSESDKKIGVAVAGFGSVIPNCISRCCIFIRFYTYGCRFSGQCSNHDYRCYCVHRHHDDVCGACNQDYQ